MKFWDSSAILSLLVNQLMTEDLNSIIKTDESICVWWGTIIELTSGIARLEREGLAKLDVNDLYIKAKQICEKALTIEPSEIVSERACDLLKKHLLRAADALQLASALEWSGGFSNEEFVCLDKKLREAAEKERFIVLPATVV